MLDYLRNCVGELHHSHSSAKTWRFVEWATVAKGGLVRWQAGLKLVSVGMYF